MQVGIWCTSNGWSIDTCAAWEIWGGDAQSDDNQRSPRIWVSVIHDF